jgi:small subunit ribosomal protein S2
MVIIPDLLEMLKAGVHFGHQPGKKYPKMDEYIHSTRNNINIIDLEKTAEKLKEAMDFITKTVSNGGTVLFVSSKKQAKDIVKKYAKQCGMPFIVSRWLGGTFTNFGNVIKLTRKLKGLEEKEKSGELAKYTKKEQLDFSREMEKLTELVGGIRDLVRLPEAVFIVDIKKDKTATAEATTKMVPIVALTDTNDNPGKVAYPIPANNDAIRSIEMITSLVAQAIEEGKK